MTLNFTDDMASPLFKQILSIRILFVSLFMREIVLHTRLVLLFQDLFPRRSSIKMYTIHLWLKNILSRKSLHCVQNTLQLKRVLTSYLIVMFKL